MRAGAGTLARELVGTASAQTVTTSREDSWFDLVGVQFETDRTVTVVFHILFESGSDFEIKTDITKAGFVCIFSRQRASVIRQLLQLVPLRSSWNLTVSILRVKLSGACEVQINSASTL